MLRHLVPLTIVLLIAVPATAEECVPSTTQPRFCGAWTPAPNPCVSGDVNGQHYIAEDCPFVQINLQNVHCMPSTWIYEESNGIAGLQRADEVVDDTCRGEIRGDTIVF